MAIQAGRVGVRADQVDAYGRVNDTSFFNKIIDKLITWVDLPVWKGGTEQLLPENDDEPETSPILCDIDYPDQEREDQYFTYRESPTGSDGIAKIESIRGNTVVWNQLVNQITKSNTANGITFSLTSTTFTIFGTCTRNSSILMQKFNAIANHMYLVKGCPVAPAALTYYISIENGDFSIHGEDSGSGVIITATSSEEFSLKFTVAEGVVLGTENNPMVFKPQLIDLTIMFGNGNEPTTVAEFTSLFPLPYYAYDTGSLLNFTADKIKTTGKNLIDFSTLQIGLNWTKSSAVDRAIIEFAVEENKEYTISFDYSSNVLNALIIFRTGWNTGQISNTDAGNVKEYTFTTPSNCKVVCVQFNARVNGFELSSGDFYGLWNCALTDTIITKTLPVLTFFPTGMKSAGEVYDELLPRRATTNIGSVDLGTLTWTYRSEVKTSLFSATMPSYKKQLDTPSICAKYDYAGTVYGVSGDAGASGVLSDKQYALFYQEASNQKIIYLYDTSFTSADSLTSSLNGVYLNYELAEPIVLPTIDFE